MKRFEKRKDDDSNKESTTSFSSISEKGVDVMMGKLGLTMYDKDDNLVLLSDYLDLEEDKVKLKLEKGGKGKNRKSHVT